MFSREFTFIELDDYARCYTVRDVTYKINFASLFIKECKHEFR